MQRAKNEKITATQQKTLAQKQKEVAEENEKLARRQRTIAEEQTARVTALSQDLARQATELKAQNEATEKERLKVQNGYDKLLATIDEAAGGKIGAESRRVLTAVAERIEARAIEAKAPVSEKAAFPGDFVSPGSGLFIRSAERLARYSRGVPL